MSRFDLRLSPRLLSGAVGVLLLAQPVVAQSSSELLNKGVCQTRAGSLIGMAWGAFILLLAGTAMYSFANGMRKMNSTDTTKITEGRQLVKGSGYSIIGALVLLAGERVFAFLGLPFLECITLPF